MRLPWILWSMLPLAIAACSDDKPAQEPVAGEIAPAAVPDAPGADGDTAKPADAAVSDVGGEAGDGSGGATETAASEADATKSTAGADVGVPGSNMVVTADGLNVRSGPGTKHKSVRVLKKGTKVSVENCSGKWCQIGDGEYVSKRYLSNAL